MAFHEIQLDPEISYGSRGGPGWNTTIIETDSGAEQRIPRWQASRHRYEVILDNKDRNQISALLSFMEARQGATYGFRYKDWDDFTTATNHRDAPDEQDCVIGVGDGVKTTFQLQKKYVSGSTTHYRTITKPVTGSVVVAINGVLQTTGYTVDYTTGEVTFDTAPDEGDVVTAGCVFDVPVRATEEVDRWLQIAYDTYATGSVSSLSLVEIKDSTPIDPNGAFFGGACETASAHSITLSLGTGRVQVVEMTTTGKKVHLPNPTGLPTGGPMWQIIAADGSQTFDLVNHDGTETFIAGVTAGQVIEVLLSIDGSGDKYWYCS